MPQDTIVARLFARANKTPNKPAYYVRKDGAWRASDWATYAGGVRRVGRALMTLGFEAGQRACILGFNRPEWVLLDVGAMAAGGVPAGIYTTSSAHEVQYIAHHTEAAVILVEDHSQWAKVKEVRDDLPHLKWVVLMDGAAAVDDDMVLTWDEFLAKADETPDADFQGRIDALSLDDLATLIYTSGTTGPPKGVMLSHRNLSWTATVAMGLVDYVEGDRSVSYLPLSHIAEQMFTIHAPITAGGRVYYAESIDKLRDNLVEVQPQVVFGVPRIWEKFYTGVKGKLLDAPELRQKIANWAMDVGRAKSALTNAGRKPGPLLDLQYRIADRLVYSKLKPALGLGEAKVCVSGAAPIASEVLQFFSGLDVNILEVYGQSEDTGPTTFNQPGRTRFGTVGPAVPGVEVKIAEDGEILVKGPNVFMGYYKDEAATAETLSDGYLHSGDLGAFEDEFLRITGRKKDIIITAGGKNITPKNIELGIKQQVDLVGEAVVIGDRRKYLSCVISLDPEVAADWAKEHGVDPDSLSSDQRVRALIQAGIDTVNADLAQVETIKRFAVLPRPLSIEDGELTPTLKVKRAKVSEHFAELIDGIYAG
ncbi:MAG: long-chain fatty acid--CoA ligase [Deltaproteobacteria bacterium]|nr:long-chain fatty acid--CoA ligase [Deltaproteobacteria bacterium]